MTGLEFVVFAVRRARKLAMHTQTTRNKNTQSCVLLFDLCVCSAAFDKRGSGEAGFYIPHASGTGALTVTVCWTYGVGDGVGTSFGTIVGAGVGSAVGRAGAVGRAVGAGERVGVGSAVVRAVGAGEGTIVGSGDSDAMAVWEGEGRGSATRRHCCVVRQSVTPIFFFQIWFLPRLLSYHATLSSLKEAESTSTSPSPSISMAKTDFAPSADVVMMWVVKPPPTPSWFSYHAIVSS